MTRPTKLRKAKAKMPIAPYKATDKPRAFEAFARFNADGSIAYDFGPFHPPTMAVFPSKRAAQAGFSLWPVTRVRITPLPQRKRRARP